MTTRAPIKVQPNVDLDLPPSSKYTKFIQIKDFIAEAELFRVSDKSRDKLKRPKSYNGISDSKIWYPRVINLNWQ
jgi:hypothetical protein